MCSKGRTAAADQEAEMAGFRWAEEDRASKDARRKSKEERKKGKLLKQQGQGQPAAAVSEAEAAGRRTRPQTGKVSQERDGDQDKHRLERGDDDDDSASKRRRLSQDTGQSSDQGQCSNVLLRFQTRTWAPARRIDAFERLNHIEQGSYGWVSRACEIATGDIVALKKLKMENSADDFPDTALREIRLLQTARHKHIVALREVIVGPRSSDVYLVMDFVEHDLSILQQEMTEPFMPSEIKTILLQIVSGVEYLHDNWILHRDLKTSNILLNNRGEIKLADFGMARHFSRPPPPNLTQLVVTRWYRAPELLLGATTYDSAIDMWSLGCIFAELLGKQPLLQGRTEADQLSKIFSMVALPNEDDWPGYRKLPNAKSLRLPPPSHNRKPTNSSCLRDKFPYLTSAGLHLLSSLLILNPSRRLTATETLEHAYFSEQPRPKPTAIFPTFPSKAGGERRRRQPSPNAPQRGAAPVIDAHELDALISGLDKQEAAADFALSLT